VPDDLRKCGQPALGVIDRTLPAHPPKVWRNFEPLKLRTPRPPFLPECAEIRARRLIKDRKIVRGEKAAHAEKDRIGMIARFAQHLQREALGKSVNGSLLLL
jgi:hypothetical protein